MNTIPITREEAERALNLLRTVQMNLEAISHAISMGVEMNVCLASDEFAGEINAAVNGLEGSIFEAGVIEFPDRDPQHGAARGALRDFQGHFVQRWGRNLEFAARDLLQIDVDSLVLLARLAEREDFRSTAGSAPSMN